MWRKYKSCLNCRTTDRPHRGKGYCNKCHGPAMRLKDVQSCDQADPERLHRLLGRPHFPSREEFELTKDAYEHQLRARLDSLRHWETSKKTAASGLDIEHQLSRIAEYAGATTRGLFHGYADYIDSEFRPKQRMALRELLRKIEKDRPWRGVNPYEVIRYKARRRERGDK